MNYRLPLCSVYAIGLACSIFAPAAQAQDPNMKHFYMGRQQVQIFDDAPLVNDMRTNPGAAAGGGGGQAGQPMGRQPLPKAGFQTYSAPIPGMQGGLPKVVNGVPPKLPSAQPKLPSSSKASAGKASYKSAPQVSSGPVATRTYSNSYQRAPEMTSGSPQSMFNSGSSNSRVKGTLLHWNKARRTTNY